MYKISPCSGYNASKDKMLFETDFCCIAAPQRPHVSREEGGHLVIFMKRKVSERYELTEEEACELMLVSIRLGLAMTLAMADNGIVLRTINYQDNGNWAFLRGEAKPTLHVHLYGRAENTQNQIFGESLYFPDPNDHPDFYDKNEPLTEDECQLVFEYFKNLSKKGSGCPVAKPV